MALRARPVCDTRGQPCEEPFDCTGTASEDSETARTRRPARSTAPGTSAGRGVARQGADSVMHSTDGRRRRVRAMPLFTDARRPAALPRLWRCAWRRAPARRDNHARKEARRRRPCATVRCTSSGQLGMHTRSRALSVTFLYPPRRSNATCTGSDETLRTALCSRLVAAGSSPPPRPCPCGAARCTKSITRHDTAPAKSTSDCHSRRIENFCAASKNDEKERGAVALRARPVCDTRGQPCEEPFDCTGTASEDSETARTRRPARSTAPGTSAGRGVARQGADSVMHSTDGRRRRVRAMPLFTDARRPAALPRLWRCAWRRAPARRDNHARKEARRRRPCATVRCTSSGQLGMHTRSRALSVTFLYPPRRSNATCTGSDETLRTALCSRLVAAGSSPPPRPCPCGAARCTKSITRHDTAPAEAAVTYSTGGDPHSC